MALPGNSNMRLEGHSGRRKPHRVWFEPRDSEQQLSTNAVGAGRWGLQGAGPVLGFLLFWPGEHLIEGAWEASLPMWSSGKQFCLD